MDNAAARDNFVSGLYEQAVRAEKETILNQIIEPEASSPEFVGELRFWQFAKLVI